MQAFGRVLRVQHVPWLLFTSVLARMPYGIEGLSIVLFVQRETGSFASAGIVSAAFGVAAGAGLPVLGRLVDVFGQTRVLLGTIVVHTGAGIALVTLGLSGASTGVLAAVAAVAGLAVAPVSPALRGLWPSLLGGDEQLLRTALALDAIALEFVFIGGPILTAVLVALFSPAVALTTGFVISAVGTAAFALSGPSRRWRGSGIGSFGLGPLRSPGLLVLLGAAVPVGFALGTLEVGLPAFGVSHDSASFGALAIAALAFGSGCAGLAYGSRPPRRPVLALIVLGFALPCGVALLASAQSIAMMLVLAPLAGAALAPLTAVQNELAGTVAPAREVTEAYAWVITATIVGFSAGTALGGAVIEAASWREAILAGSAVGLAGAFVAFLGRSRLLESRT